MHLQRKSAYSSNPGFLVILGLNSFSVADRAMRRRITRSAGDQVYYVRSEHPFAAPLNHYFSATQCESDFFY